MLRYTGVISASDLSGARCGDYASSGVSGPHPHAGQCVSAVRTYQTSAVGFQPICV
jgi:hypothetical protein